MRGDSNIEFNVNFIVSRVSDEGVDFVEYYNKPLIFALISGVDEPTIKQVTTVFWASLFEDNLIAEMSTIKSIAILSVERQD